MTLLNMNAVCAGYAAHRVLFDFTARIAAGEVVVLIGANASGKSKLVRVLSGLHEISGGAVVYTDLELGSRPPVGLAVAPNMLPERLTGFHALDLVAAALRTNAIKVAIDYATVVDLYPYMHAPIASYSLGTRQKLAISLAMVGTPRLLLLDESLNGLDLPSVGRTLKFLRELTQVSGQSVLLVTHNIDLAQSYAQRVWMLENGRLAREWKQDELSRMQCEGQLISSQVMEHLNGA
ncbi:ABC transporter ATP-binding protein [Xanthomonas axonopodis pv. vasculorum]|uniref:ATP-binding cassette domain-containing protein n=1 Tax=Xanthomonas axonopodis TaxID=53413 RepID=UPI001071506B|nr:ABC transporter ATP-binding protein [Xanthomonas axonopodis]QKD88372.1 ABC transporter ATP-binding protein [Xanthomonas axonopodis pv. vasculorum]